MKYIPSPNIYQIYNKALLNRFFLPYNDTLHLLAEVRSFLKAFSRILNNEKASVGGRRRVGTLCTETAMDHSIRRRDFFCRMQNVE